MILDGFKFSISFLKDNFIKLLLIVSIPFILELLINSISAFSFGEIISSEYEILLKNSKVISIIKMRIILE